MPIPTLPAVVTLIRSVDDALKTRSTLSVVPKKFVAADKPELPVTDQPVDDVSSPRLETDCHAVLLPVD